MSTLDRINTYVRNSATFKLIGVGILALLLLIPANMVDSLIYERQNLRDIAIGEISSKWGDAQRLAGPVIQVPYTEVYKISDDEEAIRKGSVYLLPDQATISTKLQSEERYRGIYVAVLYTTDIKVTGRFDSLKVDRLAVPPSSLDWSKASLCFGVEDLRGIDSLSRLTFGNQRLDFEPGLAPGALIRQGFQAPIELSENNSGVSFSFSFSVRGNSSISFTPLAANTSVSMQADWNTPKFIGAFLPDSREITDAGFSASWNILEVNRPFPQVGNLLVGESSPLRTNGRKNRNSTYEADYRTDYVSDNSSELDMGAYDFGVDLLLPVDDYRKTIRSSKYSSLFIAATFLTFFFIEVLNGRRLHPVQYLLVGFAIILFYVLLISLSEHLGFDLSYLISVLVILGLVMGYCKSVLGTLKLTLLVGGILTVLYGFFYSLLQLEDYALLLGSFGLLLALATIMYLTRKTDWYNLGRPEAGRE